MKSKGASKNNVANRGKSAELKSVDGKVVKPVLYKDKTYGSYMAAKFDDGSLVLDHSGKPLPYKVLH